MPDSEPHTLTVVDAGERVLQGIAVSPGIALGPAYVYERESYEIAGDQISEEAVPQELDRFERAVKRSERDLNKIISVTREKLGADSAAIFDAQRLMLRDDAFYAAVLRAIREERHNTAFAVKMVMDKHRRLMEASDSEYLRERSHDLLDVQDRIVRHLRRSTLFSAIDSNSVVVSQTLTAADMVLFSRRGILGCATEYGGPTSHVSIMARSLGLPAVVGVSGVSEAILSGSRLIIDGFAGTIYVNPTEETLGRFKLRAARYERLKQEDKQLVPLRSETLDGHPVQLQANLEVRDEVPQLAEYGADGIGLFRTEMLFLMEGRISVPEEEQYRIYREIVETVSPGATTFRVLDLGGDKLLPMAHREHNPFLGWRGIRVLLDRPELLRTQLRAVLRASAHGPTRLMIPMVTDIREIHSFRDHLETAKSELLAEGVSVDENVPVGIMIEVPSAALLADRFAPEVDFFSIGTNDLTQYTLAVDRGNDLVAPLYRDLHPAVLLLIQRTVREAHKAGIPVSVCGELATNLRAVPVLIGLGVDSLSVAPVYLPSVKRVVRAMTRREGEDLAEMALAARDAGEAEAELDRWLEEHACGLEFFLSSANG